jgi:hypothetical protein
MLTLGNYLTPNLIGGKNSLVVHRTDLQPVYRQLQLEPGGGLRLPPAGAFLVRWSGSGSNLPARSSARWCNDPLTAQHAILHPGLQVVCGPVFSCSFSHRCSLRVCWPSMTPSFRRFPGRVSPFEWFTADLPDRVGIFHDSGQSVRYLGEFRGGLLGRQFFDRSSAPAVPFLFEQENFRFKQALYFLMLAPLVVPGVILGISILLFANTLGIVLRNYISIWMCPCSGPASGWWCWANFPSSPPW